MSSVKNKSNIKEQFERVNIQDRIGICKTCSKYDKCFTWCYGRQYEESIKYIIKRYIKNKIKRFCCIVKGK